MSNRYLAYFLAMAGLAGVLYGLGTNGVMSIAKPYIEATTGFDAVHLSLLVGCCLLGSVCVNFVAGTLSDWFGRRKMFLLGALLFAFGSFVVGGVHREFGAMYCGILTQGLGMGIVAVVMPMYIAETLPKEIRGRGTGFFQLVMIGGILASGLIGLALSFCVGPADSPTLGLAEKEWCWHVVYWIVGGLAAALVLGAVYEAEKPGVSAERRERILRFVPLKPHQVKRIRVFLFPEEDSLGAGYNLRQAQISIGSGGLTGKGIGRGETNHLKYLPQAISMNDFIFCVYAEETGFVGALGLLLLFGLLLAGCCRVAFFASDGCGRLLVLGVSTLVFAHVYVNIAMSVGLVPITGLPLPFISSGRTFLITVMSGLGLVQSVSLHREEKE